LGNKIIIIIIIIQNNETKIKKRMHETDLMEIDINLGA
jgi:hypothetical protein